MGKSAYIHSMNPQLFNRYLFFKLPAAWWTGVRLTQCDGDQAHTRVRYRWVNQNPFGSMFWAVQGMAAELATGALVMYHLTKSGTPVSMLVAQNKAVFHKKAKGVITFVCADGPKIKDAMEQTIKTGEGVLVWTKAVGTDDRGVIVAEFNFEWTLKRKS